MVQLMVIQGGRGVSVPPALTPKEEPPAHSLHQLRERVMKAPLLTFGTVREVIDRLNTVIHDATLSNLAAVRLTGQLHAALWTFGIQATVDSDGLTDVEVYATVYDPDALVKKIPALKGHERQLKGLPLH